MGPEWHLNNKLLQHLGALENNKRLIAKQIRIGGIIYCVVVVDLNCAIRPFKSGQDFYLKFLLFVYFYR